MPGRKWTGEEKANIVMEILTTSTSTAEICRRTMSDQPWFIAGEQVSFMRVQEAYQVQMHRIEKSSLNRKIRDSKKWWLTLHWQMSF